MFTSKQKLRLIVNNTNTLEGEGLMNALREQIYQAWAANDVSGFKQLTARYMALHKGQELPVEPVALSVVSREPGKSAVQMPEVAKEL